MKYLLLAVLLFTSLSWGETSTERAKIYFSAIESRDFSAAAGHFDPDHLREFRHMMEFYKEIPPEVQIQLIQALFGADQTVESLDKISDVEFFAGVFNFIMRQVDAAGGLNFDGVEILGEVKEGDDISHLVTRSRVSVGKIEMEAMEVISLKKSREGWRVLMSGKIKGLPDQLKRTFAGTKK